MSKSKCTGACCKHVAGKLALQVSDSRYERLTKRVDESKKLADLYRELGIIHGQYAEDVGQLLFEVSIASMSGSLASEIGNACVLPQELSEMSNSKPNGRLKSAIKKHGRNFA